MNWGVSAWPTLTQIRVRSQARARATGAAKKKASSGKKQRVGTVSSVSARGEGSTTSKPFVDVPPAPDWVKHARTAEKSRGRSPTPHALTPVEMGPAPSSSCLKGVTRSIFLEDLGTYVPTEGGPGLTPAARRLKAIDLRNLCTREKWEIEALVLLVSNRLAFAQECLLDLVGEDDGGDQGAGSGPEGSPAEEDRFAVAVRRQIKQGEWSLFREDH